MCFNIKISLLFFPHIFFRNIFYHLVRLSQKQPLVCFICIILHKLLKAEGKCKYEKQQRLTDRKTEKLAFGTQQNITYVQFVPVIAL